MLNFVLRIKKNIPYFISIFVFINMFNLIEAYYLNEKFVISRSVYDSILSSSWIYIFYLLFIKEDSKLSLRNILKAGFLGAFLGLFALWIKNKNYKKIMKIMWKSEKISGRYEEDSKDS
ncbi:hypothetical protein HMPREF1049_1589 [Fusobacterium necrophorum subsp. funduliforme ATCC 51357]|uniref:Uncharacterized protein n=1 Tax=Fusobacterium necrophorum subsp. funduliforme TaxID=143387 RepID=A0A161PPX7_9FUSO|nr:hypothetical protein [Fusobacterium necrophorum]AYV93760.1 hypothetical protein BSQ88_08800 [Fusobacterium necrophorum subsp. funduliforme]EIJ72461.1 hypothetical protein HMPREF1049_1589 [Fusobacterium necrophorum subsp. funduliforme ATCC 51357]KAB0552926.1 hypothetical protein F7P76_06070 [Fusobacterium necrophorum subsp. funduliforme]KYL01170.1 hypothetical protein A2J07_07835 [Fusobacterium necrophorum subsp. funduliforme]KYM42186.1 hypothetical protein A2U05_07025 [Fusobacterium necroph